MAINNSSPISHWVDAENISASAIDASNKEFVAIDVPIQLPERRIYLFLSVNPTTATGFVLSAKIRAYMGRTLVGEFPASLADLTGVGINRSLSCLFNGAGSPVGDSLVLTVASPFTGGTVNPVLQPFRLNAEIDHISWDLDFSIAGSATGYRAYLGCCSTKF
jgi:hypothetical protein